MREVAVTEGDKVEAQARFGFSVNGYGIGELARRVAEVDDAAVTRLCGEYDDSYELAAELQAGGDAPRLARGTRHASSWACARSSRMVASVRSPTPSRTSASLRQLPGIAAQRLMADGYGFGGEGDWKSAALVRIVKVMSDGLAGGTSFMEDYTYDFGSASPLVLGAHMLEVCPSIIVREGALRDPPALDRRARRSGAPRLHGPTRTVGRGRA